MISGEMPVFNEIGKRLPVPAKACILGHRPDQRDIGL
jgi:hypothetical protein